MRTQASRRILFGFSVAAIILACVGVLVVFSSLRVVQDARWVAETTSILTHMDDVMILERQAISHQRGYLLMGDRHLRDGFWAARAQIPDQMGRLKARVKHPPVLALLEALAPKLEARLAIASETMAVNDTEGLAAAQRHIAAHGSLQLDQEISALFTQVHAEESQLLAERRRQSERSATQLLIAAAAGIPLSLIILASIYIALVRENAFRRLSERDATNAAAGFEKASADLAALTRYAGMLQSCEDATELYAVTHQALKVLVPGLAGTVYLIRPSRDHAEVALSWGRHTVPSRPTPAPMDCWSVRRNQPFACDDVLSQTACTHVEPYEASAVSAATACLPLSAHGHLMGWMYLSGPAPGPMRGIGLALQAAEQFSLALANVRLQEELRHQSIRDPLSGLFNRRYLEESLAREISRCIRRKLPLVVLMLDLDHFKTFNDRHGHPGGDAVISAFGRLLQSSCRSEDIPCRYGGEEFTLILPEASAEVGLERARAILAATAQMVVAHQGMPLARVTASIGMASLPDHGTSAVQLLEAADAALYQAKSGGRNRVCAAPAIAELLPHSSSGQ